MNKATEVSIKRIARIVDEYKNNKEGITESVSVRDILTDIMHYCDFNHIHFENRLEGARSVYEEEVQL